MQRRQNASLSIGLVVSLLCALMASTGRANADSDVQLIRFNNQSFFIPKSWMVRLGAINAVRATPGGGIEGRWSEPQAEPIDATDLTLMAPDRNAAIVKVWTEPLPSLIHISSYRGTPRDLSGLLPETKKSLDIAASKPADADGFVRVWPEFAKPGQQSPFERFLYKGYLNQLGQPLIIFSDNLETPLGVRYPSDVYIVVKRDLSLHYMFSNKEFPINAWWNLYKQTRAFLDYLQNPK